jgi:hypothetical protein
LIVALGLLPFTGFAEEVPFRPHPSPPPRHEPVACYAQNQRGEFFRAVGRNPRGVQQLAMKRCLRTSRSCRPLGCRRIGR